MKQGAKEHRDNLLAIYHAALAAVEGRHRVASFLRTHPLSGPLHVVAIGKAAAAMARGVLDVLEPEVQRLLVVTRHGYGQAIRGAHPGLVLVEAGHPVPDARSLRAGRLLLEMIDEAPANAGFLFLISGGASSLLEMPRPGITLSDLQRVNRWLLAAGLPIQEMNRIRKALSTIKGGRLLSRLAGRRVWNLLISDVPGDDPAVIGSGLLIASGDRLPASEAAPAWLHVLLARAGRVREPPCRRRWHWKPMSLLPTVMPGRRRQSRAGAWVMRSICTTIPSPVMSWRRQPIWAGTWCRGRWGCMSGVARLRYICRHGLVREDVASTWRC